MNDDIEEPTKDDMKMTARMLAAAPSAAQQHCVCVVVDDDTKQRKLTADDCEAGVFVVGGAAGSNTGYISWKQRIYEELALFVVWLRFALICLAYNLYVVFMTSRNLAFYRFPVGTPNLPDAGFDIIPASDGWLSSLMAELPVKLALVAVFVICGFSLFDNRRDSPKPHAVSMLLRMGIVCLIGQSVRILTFLSTSLPGASTFCSSPDAGLIQPQTLREVFLTRFVLRLNGNCGDLLFSGHMLHLIIFVSTFCRYADACFAPRIKGRSVSVLKFLLWCTVLVQAVGIISLRHHYTVDVVVACYFTPLLWYWYCHKISPVDYTLPPGRQQQAISIPAPTEILITNSESP